MDFLPFAASVRPVFRVCLARYRETGRSCQPVPLAIRRNPGQSARMEFETVILGAGAAGMMCAAHAGPRTLLIDHARNPGEKIRISGGGRCNFTNLYAGPENYLSANPHFCKSALARYTQWDFIDLVDRHGIAWHENAGQLFATARRPRSSPCCAPRWTRRGHAVAVHRACRAVENRRRLRAHPRPRGKRVAVTCRNLVLATGGKSIPKMGATGLAYDIARQFGLTITETRPALVPFTFPEGALPRWPGSRCPRGCRIRAPRSTRRCFSPIAGCPARRCCNCRPTGARARRSR